jgi:opacity protein-like surface antigen
MNKIVLAAGLAGLLGFTLPAAQADELYGQVGTEGVGIGYARPLGQNFNVRGEFNGFALSHGFDAGDNHYDAHLKLLHGGLYADVFPMPALVPFRFTAGVLIGNDHLDGTTEGSVDINGVVVNTGESVNAKVKLPTVRPYLGIGLGHTPVAQKGFSVFADLGVAYGKPTVDFDVPANIASAAGPENVSAEEQQVRDKVDKYKFYPIVKVGVTYRF